MAASTVDGGKHAVGTAETAEHDAQVRRVLVVEGMHCAGCAAAVEARLRRQPGVIEAAVNFTADSAVLRWETASTSFARLQHAVARLGYRLYDPADADNDDAGLDAVRRALQRRLAIAVFFGMWSMMPSLLIYLAPLGLVEPQVLMPLAIAAGIMAAPVILYAGSHFYRVGWRTLRAGVPGLDSLIAAAVAAASLVSLWHLLQGSSAVYFDAAVMLITFQLLARLIDSGVRRRASAIIRGYLNLAPPRARVWRQGAWCLTAADDVTAGQRLRLAPGEELALDGRITAGVGEVDLSLISGETTPRRVARGQRLEAGCRLLAGELELCVTAGVGARRLDAIARSVRALLSHKSAMQRLADRLARWLLPLILAAAVAAVGLGWLQGRPPDRLIVHGLAVLIIACPCALSLAIPLVVVLGQARLVALGILFRDPAALEAAASTEVIVFDKTGTLTTGTPTLAAALPGPALTPEALIQLARDALDGVAHPIAAGLRATAAASSRAARGRRENHPGAGVAWQWGTTRILAGRRGWLREHGVRVPAADDDGMVLHLAQDGRYLGRLLFRESLRPEAAATVARLKAAGYPLYLLSGDTPRACEAIARALGLAPERVLAGRSPEQKSRFVAALERRRGVAFVGDGLNDGPALAGARLGIAVGTATPAASHAAAVTLPDGLARIPDTLRLAGRARRLMRGNLGWAIGYNTLVIPLAVAGYIAPVLAAMAMTLSSLCVMANSLRIRRGDRAQPLLRFPGGVLGPSPARRTSSAPDEGPLTQWPPSSTTTRP